MKKIPKSLENKIRSCAKHYEVANQENQEILEWFFKNNYSSSLNDMLIDSCQVINSSENFINFLNGEIDENGYSINDFMGKDKENFDDFL